MLQSFILKLLAEATKNEDIRAFVSDLVDQAADKVKTDLLPDLLKSVIPLLPVFGESLMKELLEHLPNIPDVTVDLAKGVAEKIVASDPDLPFISDIIDISEILRGFLR